MENKYTEERKQLLEAFLENPSTYHIEVLENSMLPEKLKEKKVLDFVVKPPTAFTLTQIAQVLIDIDEDIFDIHKTDDKIFLNYIPEMVRIFCLATHAKDTEYPEWYEEFIIKNATANEILRLFKEVSVKSQTGFFLTSLKIAGSTNPMMMKIVKEEARDLIRTNSLEG